MKSKIPMKLLGLAAILISYGANILGDYISSKQMEQTIQEEVSKALAEKN